MAKEVKQENEAVASIVTNVEQFLDTNKKIIWGIILAIAVIAGAAYLYYKTSFLPAKDEALGQVYMAEASFRAGNYELALNGDDNNPGFKDIIDEYGKKAGKSAYLYAAICELQCGNPDGALEFLSSYRTSDRIMAGRAKALKGDALCEKEEYAKAAAAYADAAKTSGNIFSAAYLLKAGKVFETLGERGKALEAYKEIKETYPQSIEAIDIDKYITRLELKK